MHHFLKVTQSLKSVFTTLCCLLFTVNIALAQGNAKKTVEVKDYAQWENLGFRSTFSNDGNWFFYDIRRNNKENEIRLHNLKDNSVKVLAEGSRAQFTADSKWLGYFINPTAKAREKSKKPLRSDFRLMSLLNGDSLTLKDVNSFSFSDNSDYLAMKRFATKGKKSKGSDLVIRNLSNAKEYSFGNVAEFRWKDDSSLIAMVIDADGKAGNGIQLFNPETGVLKVLDSKEAVYSGIRWREDADDLTVFRSFEDEGYEGESQHVLAWRNVFSKKVSFSVLDQASIEGFPEHHKIITSRSLVWSDNGKQIFLVLKLWEQKPKKEEKDGDKDKESYQDLTDEAPALQIWHSKDVKVIPEQELSASRRRDNQFLSVWHIDENKFVQLEDELVESVRLQTGVNNMLGFDATPYEKDAMFGRGSSDIYIVDISTGTKTKALSKTNTVSSVDPNGKFIAYVKGDDYYVYNTKDMSHQRLTNGEASFLNYDDDHPTPEKRPYGIIAWEKSGNSFFVHSKYDVWQLQVNGKNHRRITNGEAEQVRHRFSYVGFEDYIDQKEEMYLSVFGNWSKKSGYAKVIPGKEVSRLIWEDSRVGRLNKAEDAEKYAYSVETFSDSPDYFVTSNFNDAVQVSETNPFQKDFAWGKSELIEYTNANGKKLQGALFYPANYEPGKKYPMITYIYELLSDGIHGYSSPSQTNYYSHTVFTQQGYFVLRPDIVFDAGDPGISSVRTMEAAVKVVVDKGLVDEKKVGLVGHSWGGYQAGYAVTQTDIFAASVAGAGLTNLTSMAGMIAWAFGGAPENAHFEVSQERMIVPIYEDVDSYVRNSSVFNVEKLNTPLLFEVGDNDKNVDWRQGIEYYNAARRARKQFVLLVYAKEGHGLRSENNSSDYQMRILKWFGHYLKGEPAPSWIEQGIPYEEQMKGLKDWKK
ncbi:prolyl oligopeptidase family serine peptidase [Roseivirga sp. E12]|uniref:S9 family peptidase n=1 Tax=Roseivirga sp. E12 TaxID=2819237 RepID=UPI001ABC1419|nr:prolyl oligopeptidase family serine peptidase [Roseivirga sp. E12]MBO3697116.1 S9 family peptidase [Roseivirga sp. E12]